jgi:hypothetical protein
MGERFDTVRMIPHRFGDARSCRHVPATSAESGGSCSAVGGRPRGWDDSFPVGRYWRAALVVFFNYVVDTGTVWKAATSTRADKPIAVARSGPAHRGWIGW